ncbi:hypothetical protein PAMP_016292 [Pampus punctatissimus]
MGGKRLACEKFTREKGKRESIEQCWRGWVSKSRLGMDPRRGDWLSQPQMEDGTHRKRINCLISARWGGDVDELSEDGDKGENEEVAKRTDLPLSGAGTFYISVTEEGSRPCPCFVNGGHVSAEPFPPTLGLPNSLPQFLSRAQQLMDRMCHLVQCSGQEAAFGGGGLSLRVKGLETGK